MNHSHDRTIGRSDDQATDWLSSPKTVRVLGHISRPAFGEARQAPDRQMFFVNRRPCGLPQVARAFNEVYKSYSVSQSPFIFADLQMDTSKFYRRSTGRLTNAGQALTMSMYRLTRGQSSYTINRPCSRH